VSVGDEEIKFSGFFLMRADRDIAAGEQVSVMCVVHCFNACV
jgi:hypothetical protein